VFPKYTSLLVTEYLDLQSYCKNDAKILFYNFKFFEFNFSVYNAASYATYRIEHYMVKVFVEIYLKLQIKSEIL
jgi:hypothetical protein